MSEPLPFDLQGDIAIVRLAGTQSFQRAARSVKESIVHAREQGFGKLLVDATGLAGFGPPTLSERHWMVREWAGVA